MDYKELATSLIRKEGTRVMIKYRVEVLVAGDTWRAIHPFGANAYAFDTRDDAIRTARMCYPDMTRIIPWENIRITEFVPYTEPEPIPATS